MNDIYLEHHGVIGQKWGVRRYQNKDGKLTSSGKKHLSLTSKTGTKSKTKTKTKTKTKSERKQEKEKVAEEKRNTLAKKRQRQKDYKNRRKLSDSELTSKIKRLEDEAKYADLVTTDISPAKKFVKTVLSDATKPVATQIVKGLESYAAYHVAAGLKEIDREKLASYVGTNPNQKKK